jgi:hypothetical protein
MALTVTRMQGDHDESMSTTRRLSLPTHGALELLIGLALLAGPFAAGLGAGGLALGVVAGTLVVGIGLMGADAIPLRTHQALDQTVAVVLLGIAVALAFAGEPAGAAVIGAAALAELLLVSGTRWTRAR